MPTLRITEGDRTWEVEVGREPVTLGRDPSNAVQIVNADVSRRHLSLMPHGEVHRLVDLGSKNGTVVNGQRVDRRVLVPGDRISIGEVVIVYAPAAALAVAGAGAGATPAVAPRAREPAIGPKETFEPCADGAGAGEADAGSASADTATRRGSSARRTTRADLKNRLLKLQFVGQTMTSELDLSRLLDTILDTVLEYAGFERGILVRVDEAGAYKVEICRKFDRDFLTESESRFSRGVVKEALDSGDIVHVRDFAEDARLGGRESVQEMGLRSALCLPLLIPTIVRPAGPSNDRRQGLPRPPRPLGAIYLDGMTAVPALGKQDRELLRLLAAQASIALHNADLHHRATTDPLTGLVNRGTFDHLLHEEFRRCRTSETPLAVMLLDVDHFKLVNDTHGHITGDEVLRAVARMVREQVRKDDVAGRYGGEEFIVLLPATTAANARVAAEKVRARIARDRLSREQVAVTVSIGVAANPEHGADPETLVKRADQALYQAKETGRNRTVVWEATLDQTGKRSDRLAGVLSGNPAKDDRNLRLLFETIELVRAPIELGAVLPAVADKVLEITRADRAVIFLRNREGEIVFRAGRKRGGKDVSARELFSRSPIERAIAERRSFCILDTDAPLLPGGKSSSIDALELKAVMCVPLAVRDRVIGAIYVDDRVASKEFTPADLLIFEAIAAQIAVALESREPVEAPFAVAPVGAPAPAPAPEPPPTPSPLPPRRTADSSTRLREENARLRRLLAEKGIDPG